MIFSRRYAKLAAVVFHSCQALWLRVNYVSIMLLLVVSEGKSFVTMYGEGHAGFLFFDGVHSYVY
jgi:hypothetical protein